MENNNGNSVLLTVIGVATLLVALVGATFAYFSATVSNANAQSVSIKLAAPGSITYEGGKALTLLNAQLGSQESATFTISNKNEAGNEEAATHKYDLKLLIDANTFRNTQGNAGKNQLVFTMNAYTTGANNPAIVTSTFDATDGVAAAKEGTQVPIVTGQKIAVDEVHSYTVTAKVNNLEEVLQDENKGAVFAGHFEVSNDAVAEP